MGSKGEKQRGPGFVRYMGPVLEAVKELGGTGHPREVEEIILVRIDVPQDEVEIVAKSGQSRFANRVALARFYLAKAGYLETSERGLWRLTEKGQTSSLDYAEADAIYRAVCAPLAKNQRTKTPNEPETHGKVYWRGTFSSQAWYEFQNNVGMILSFTKDSFAEASLIEPGDIILCCIRGLNTWVGILQATGRHMVLHPRGNDHSGRLPLQVTPVLVLDIGHGIPMHDSAAICPDEANSVRSSYHWGAGRGSCLKKYKREDGELLFKAIQDAHISAGADLGLATRPQHTDPSDGMLEGDDRVDIPESERSVEKALPSAALA